MGDGSVTMAVGGAGAGTMTCPGGTMVGVGVVIVCVVVVVTVGSGNELGRCLAKKKFIARVRIVTSAVTTEVMMVTAVGVIAVLKKISTNTSPKTPINRRNANVICAHAIIRSVSCWFIRGISCMPIRLQQWRPLEAIS